MRAKAPRKYKALAPCGSRRTEQGPQHEQKFEHPRKCRDAACLARWRSVEKTSPPRARRVKTIQLRHFPGAQNVAPAAQAKTGWG
eukprot:6245735-Pyramimonas_sp.AAC.1